MTKKEQLKAQARQTKNREYKKKIKNQFKKVEVYLKENQADEKELKKLSSETQKILDQASSKRIIHKNKAARKKSQLYKNVNNFLNKKEEINKKV